MFHFVPNLKPYTLHRGSGNRRFDSYLVSVDYAAGHRDLIREVLAGRRVLSADNGNVGRIRKLIGQFKAAAKTLDDARKGEEDGLGGYAQPGQLSTVLSARYAALAEQIRVAAEETLPPAVVSQAVGEQLALSPTWLVGMEELSLPCMTAISMEREYTALPLGWYGDCSARAIEYAQKTQRGEFGPSTATVFAGLHALDFDTAVQAGRMAAEGGQTAIASGLVGAMKDNNFTDYRVQDGAVVPLGGTVARPYLRVIEIAAGMQLGYARLSGKRLLFHALGPGSPILLPLLGLLSAGGTYNSADSTAPIKDAVSSRTVSLYVDEPAPLKLKAHRLAESWLSGGRGWDCSCPYCRGLSATDPPMLQKAASWWKGEGRRKIRATDMWAPSPLAELLPILSNSADPAVRHRAGLARTGHNHWLLKRLESQIRARDRDLPALRDWVASVAAAYGAHGRSKPWIAAALQAAQMADQAAVELAGVAPGGMLP